jgi:hypothetical protein
MRSQQPICNPSACTYVYRLVVPVLFRRLRLARQQSAIWEHLQITLALLEEGAVYGTLTNPVVVAPESSQANKSFSVLSCVVVVQESG